MKDNRNNNSIAEEENTVIARRGLIRALPFIAVGGIMALFSSCTPGRNTARRTSRHTSMRVSRRR